MKKFLIISWEQFGYHTDNFNYAYYLRDKFKIMVICFDEGLKKNELSGVNVVYIKNLNNKILRRLIFNITIMLKILTFSPDLIFVRYFRTCSFLTKIFDRKKIIVDIRTASVEKRTSDREKYNKVLSKECNKFDNITVISEGLIDKLSLDKLKVTILPLGAKKLIKNTVSQDKVLKLLYVGTFDGRNIDVTIKAFNKFSEIYGSNHEYKIIGFAYDEKIEKKITEAINDSKLKNIKYLGRIPNEELGKYFEKSNIGVSYVPITDYFEHQPPTKSYEYLMNGLFTIATNTYENRKIINENNGILIKDTEEDFFLALEQVVRNVKKINKDKIIKSIDKYSWENICSNLEKKLFEIMKS